MGVLTFNGQPGPLRKEVRATEVRMPLEVRFRCEGELQPAEVAGMELEWLLEASARLRGRDWGGRSEYGIAHIELSGTVEGAGPVRLLEV
jgi:hypothetical protein